MYQTSVEVDYISCDITTDRLIDVQNHETIMYGEVIHMYINILIALSITIKVIYLSRNIHMVYSNMVSYGKCNTFGSHVNLK